MPSPSVTDDELLRALRTGDQVALSHLLERHAAAVYRFGLRLCGNAEDAREVVQETLLIAVKGLSNFRGEASLSTWFYSVARSVCAKKHRRSKFAPNALESLHDGALGALPGETAMQPDEIAQTRELTGALDAALAALEPSAREVLVLRDVDGFSAKEVSEIVGVSVDAVKSRLHRARAQLRERLEPFFPNEQRTSRARARPNCPEIVSVFSRYLEGDIGAVECAAMQAHVAECKRCDAACESLRHSLALCQKSGQAEIPEAVQAMVRLALRGLLRHPAG